MAVDWNELLLAFLHDPPDKAYAINVRDEIPGHESRRLEIAKAVLGDDEVSQQRIKKTTSAVDVMAAQIERLAMPKGVHVNIQQDVMIVHPLSGTCEKIDIPVWHSSLLALQCNQLRSVTGGLNGAVRFLAAWRLWPEELVKNHEFFEVLPAETRNPDHTIWNHLDITVAFKAAKSEGDGAALLAFALGPVQRFIEAARSVRDLWSGSMILSWLAFRSLLPVVERLGPTALVYPSLRGNPLLDLWLANEQRLGGKVPLPEVQRRLTPSLPHRFLAIVPWGADGVAAHALAGKCRDAFTSAWQELANAVKQAVQRSLATGWDKRWDNQIGEYFNASTAVVPLAGTGEEVDNRLARLLANRDSFGVAFQDAEAVRKLAGSIPASDQPNYNQDHAGRWQYQVELVGRSLASQRSIRHVPANAINQSADQTFPQKCTLLGTFEQVGPDDLRQSKDFWDKATSQNGLSIDGVRLRQGEALCAVAMVKRFAGPAFLRGQLRLSVNDLRFPDTWTVSAAQWLADAGIDWKAEWRNASGKAVPWNGHWLQWSAPAQDLEDADPCPAELWARIQEARGAERFGPPPVYYAILKLDGDDLGGWLRGEKSPMVRESMHPKMVDYYENHCGDAKNTERLNAKRPVGPALHAAISTALSNFALHVVPAVVEKHHGTVIYSGGDDTLILLPVSTALACAMELRHAYMSDWYGAGGRKYLLMGSRATLSGGLVVVHAKDDLRLAVADARAAEKKAKDAGKDALGITIRRHSGEHTSAICPWSFAREVTHWTEQFRSGASDRWAYHLYAIRLTLASLPVAAIQAEMRRQIQRAESPTRELIPPDRVAKAFEEFRSSTMPGGGSAGSRFGTIAEALQQFLTLCHTASFLSRGRDR